MKNSTILRRTLLASAMVGAVAIADADLAGPGPAIRASCSRRPRPAAPIIRWALRFATLIKTRLQPTEGIDLSAISSAGSGENVRLLREGEVDFAILQGLFGAYASNGTGPLEEEGPAGRICAPITGLWQNTEHFVMRSIGCRERHHRGYGECDGRARFDGCAGLRHARFQYRSDG